MDISKLLTPFRSERYKALLSYSGLGLVGLIIFGGGIFIGHRIADFGCRWDQNYPRQFGGPGSPFMGTDDRPSMPHGALGAIIGINFPSFAIKSSREPEKIIIIGSSTMIREGRSSTSSDALHIGTNVIVIGDPDDSGRISASLIRIMPDQAINLK